MAFGVSNNLYDAFGVLRYTQGSAQTPWRWKNWQQGEEGLNIARGWRFYLPERILVPLLSISNFDNFCPFREGGPYPRSMCDNFLQGCVKEAGDEYARCKVTEDALSACGFGSVACQVLVPPLGIFCSVVGAGCALADFIKPDCGDVHAGKINFCISCHNICVHNSIPDKK